MPESDVMPSGEAASKSPLDKPLDQLTEEDISQLTREDCRLYLKKNGMRRPSWNKSQAIQQVISLKRLREPSPDSHSGASKSLYIPPVSTASMARVPQVPVAEAEISDSAEEAVWTSRKDVEKPNISDQTPAPPAAASNKSAPSRIISGLTDILVGQMTIFYCGQVNVYDDVPADKVQAIMHLAGSPIHVPPDCPSQHLVSHLHPPDVEAGQDSSFVFLPLRQSVKKCGNSHVQMEDSGPFYEDNPVEGSGSRKASVQRYLEKRKDRFKNKRRAEVSSSPSLDIYLKPQMSHHTANEHSDNTERTMEGRLT